MPTDQRDIATVAAALGDLAQPLMPDEQSEIDVREAGGNAGFSYLFDVSAATGTQRYFLRLAPPGVRHVGIADLRRQTTALRALAGSRVPHADVVLDGEHPDLGPYLITEVVAGSTRGTAGSLAGFSDEQRVEMAQAAMRALVALHDVAWDPTCGYLGAFAGHAQLVLHWDRFFEKGAYRDELREPFELARGLLLANAPDTARLALCHGDYQFGNLMFDHTTLTAVVDWELCGISPALSDLGWIMAFHDPAAWGSLRRESASYFTAEQLRSLYVDAGGTDEGVEWYQALAHYKYAVIASLNLMLHRRGKREDAEWEVRGPGAFSNMARATAILGRL